MTVDETDVAFLTAAGALSSGVLHELHTPLREIRESLAVLVETLDRHFSEASGPVPYPWPATKALRERLAETYLLCRTVTRTSGDLERAVSTSRTSVELVEPNSLIEQSVGLARHRFGEDRELDIDAGDVPPVRALAGELVLLFASLLVDAASSSATVMVRTRRDQEQVVIQVSRSERPSPSLPVLAKRVLTPVGGELVSTSGEGGAPLFEIRLPVGR
jgi:signal transduction histidine kinase